MDKLPAPCTSSLYSFPVGLIIVVSNQEYRSSMVIKVFGFKLVGFELIGNDGLVQDTNN